MISVFSNNMIKNLLKKDKFFYIFIICLVFLVAVSLFINKHVIDIHGDAIDYVSALHVLNGESFSEQLAASDFIMHRILTTFLNVEVMGIFSAIFGSENIGWLIWNIILYFVVNIVFYRLLLRMFKSPMTALLGALFFASNYAMVTAGLGYFMDIGGWTFYILSVYYLFGYIESKERKNIWISALFMAVGAFFKENSLFAYIPFFCVMSYGSYRSLRLFINNIILPSVLIFIPIAIHHLNVYIAFDHGYLYWVRLNQTSYLYSSRLIEYIKNFGSLLTFLAPISLVGLIIYIKSGSKRLLSEFNVNTEKTIFIISILVSSIPAIMWPGITQRVLFMVVPGLVILACFFIRRYERYWFWFVILILIYVIFSFMMDPVILKVVNLPF